MISAIEGIPLVEEENPYASKESKNLGRDEFLKLFLAQLNHQDPLNPMDGTQFSSQLAQFSSLEQLFNVNENLESIKAAQDGDGFYQILDLIGKEIEAEGNSLSLMRGETASGGFYSEIPAECSVLISDQNGYPVRELSMGMIESGEHSFKWDGRDQDGNLMESGIYTYEVAAMDPSGEIMPVETRIRGVVDRINLDGEEPLLYIGSTAIQLSQIMNVNIPPGETDPS
jgi:flagellar basal-body rod modification protein FlgD